MWALVTEPIIISAFTGQSINTILNQYSNKDHLTKFEFSKLVDNVFSKIYKSII